MYEGVVFPRHSIHLRGLAKLVNNGISRVINTLQAGRAEYNYKIQFLQVHINELVIHRNAFLIFDILQENATLCEFFIFNQYNSIAKSRILQQIL